MNIVLINPPSPFLLDDRVFPSLGVLKVASYLMMNGHDVRVCDLAGQKDLSLIDEYMDCDVFGITATTPQMPNVLNIIGRLHGKRVVLGGPHVTLVHAAVRKEHGYGRANRAWEFLKKNFSQLVSGDGVEGALAAFENPDLLHIDTDSKSSEWWMTSKDYTQSPDPARELVDIRSYKYEIEGNPATSLIAQLGCPFQCGFCGGRNSPSLRVTRNRPSDDIVNEVESLYKNYGFTGFMFYDDELNVNPKFVDLLEKLTGLQERLGVSFRLRGFLKAELFTDQQAEAMYRAGFRWVLCGFEGAHERILTNIRKRATLEDNNRVIELGKKHGLKVKALMSIGHPGESEETVDAISEWLVANDVDDFDCTVITPYPGTPYYDESRWTGYCWEYEQPDTKDKLYSRSIDYTKESNFYKGIPGSYKSMVWTDYLSDEELAEMRDELEDHVRGKLGLAYPGVSKSFEQSMGQTA